MNKINIFRINKFNKVLSINDNLIFSFIVAGNISQNTLQKMAGCDTPCIKKHISNLIECGFIDSEYKVLKDIKNLCKIYTYVKNVSEPKKLNLGNWTISTILTDLSQQKKLKRKASIMSVMTSLGMVPDSKIRSKSDKRKIKRWEDKINALVAPIKPEVAPEAPIVVQEVAEVALVEIEHPTLNKIEPELSSDILNDDSIYLGMHSDEIKDMKDIERMCKNKFPVNRMEIKNLLLREARNSYKPVPFVWTILKKRHLEHEKVLDRLIG